LADEQISELEAILEKAKGKTVNGSV
jgi:hypothetical protein